jgi:hypothetical protein
VGGAFEAAASDVGDHGGAGVRAEQPRQVVVGQADRRRDLGNRDRRGQVLLDVGERFRHRPVVSLAAGTRRDLRDAPEDDPGLGVGTGAGFGGGGDRLAEHGRQDRCGRAGVLHDRHRLDRAPNGQARVEVEVRSGAPIAEEDLGAGRDQADVPGLDGVHGAAELDLGLVVVQVHLPQLGQEESLLGQVESVQAGPGVDDDRGFVEVQ